MTAPLNKLPKTFLNRVDIIIKSAVKEILSIPTDTPDALLYTSNKLRGLSIARAHWEAYLQHLNICIVLINSGNQYIPHCRDIEQEMDTCFKNLGFDRKDYDEVDMRKLTKTLRLDLREKIFLDWTQMSLKGLGVDLYRESEQSNKLIMRKVGLSNSEWTSIIKMSANVTAVRGNARSGNQDHRCRHCGAEKESLAHVLDYCEHGKLLIINRHNTIRTLIANSLRTKNWIVHEEIFDPTQSRRVDMIAYSKDKKEGFIIDPTVIFEKTTDQPDKAHVNKCAIYNPCIPFFQQKYLIKNIEVIGLMIGARGTIPLKFQEFCGRFNLPKSLIEDVAVATVKYSVQILHHHFKPPITPSPQT